MIRGRKRYGRSKKRTVGSRLALKEMAMAFLQKLRYAFTGREQFIPERRRFAKLALAGTLSSGALLSRPVRGDAKMYETTPGIKISVQVGSDPSDEDLQFVKQLGAEYVNI